MAWAKNSTIRWGVILICLVLGTWLGLFMQRFGATSAIFANFVNFSVDIKQIDIVMLRFGFFFAVKINLGTVIGGALGVWVSR